MPILTNLAFARNSTGINTFDDCIARTDARKCRFRSQRGGHDHPLKHRLPGRALYVFSR